MSIEQLYDGTGSKGDLVPAIDIVAVHGLNPMGREDHAISTWQDLESGHLWLRDALPVSHPDIRTLIYSYESSPAFGTDKERFIYQANSLLECLRLTRRKDPKRPLIFIGHSLGGILIKQALVNAQNNPKYKALKEATFGIVFFGTPHSGPTEDLKVKFGRACVSIAQSMPWKVSNDIMEALKKGSLFSDVLYENWRHQLEQYHFISFYEGLGILVPRASATFGLSGERENQVRLNATHSDMCRFNPSIQVDKKNYFLVEGNITDLRTLCLGPEVDENEFNALIISLSHLGSNPRLTNISEKHNESFHWIWKNDTDGPHFSQWAASDNPVYWITGLPGCGKSTMMKYLYEDLKTKSFLGKSSNTIMGYFFHQLGEARERTFEGLLASLIMQLLLEYNSLAPLVLSVFRQLRKSRGSSTQLSFWTEPDLKKVMDMITRQSKVIGKAIIFIDGLDECAEDHRQQLDTLLKWIQTSHESTLHLKMCLASRSLVEMEIRLARFPNCEIHKWTAGDISKYVVERLADARKLLAGRGHEFPSQYGKDLVEIVVEKARGVFLWVEIVVNNLIIGLEEGDTNNEIVARLQLLPSGLENLYHRIIEQVPNNYIHDTINYTNLLISRDLSLRRRRRAYRIIQVGPRREERFNLIEFSFAIRGAIKSFKDFNHFTIESSASTQNYCELVELRIKSRCRGLIHVVEEMSDNDESMDEDDALTDEDYEQMDEDSESINEDDDSIDESEKHNRPSNIEEDGLKHPDEYCAEENEESENESEESYSSPNYEEERLHNQQGNIQLEGIPITKPLLDPLIASAKKAVDFLHLTVKEYLTSEEVMASMRARADESLISSPYVDIMTASLSLMKMIGPKYLFRNWDDIDVVSSPLLNQLSQDFAARQNIIAFGIIDIFFDHARQAEKETGSSQRPLLIELDQICSLSSNIWREQYAQRVWTSESKIDASWNTDILCLAVLKRLDTYVREEFEIHGYRAVEREGRPLLQYYFDDDLGFDKDTARLTPLLAFLLVQGALPDHDFRGKAELVGVLSRLIT